MKKLNIAILCSLLAFNAYALDMATAELQQDAVKVVSEPVESLDQIKLGDPQDISLSDIQIKEPIDGGLVKTPTKGLPAIVVNCSDGSSQSVSGSVTGSTRKSACAGNGGIAVRGKNGVAIVNSNGYGATDAEDIFYGDSTSDDSNNSVTVSSSLDSYDGSGGGKTGSSPYTVTTIDIYSDADSSNAGTLAAVDPVIQEPTSTGSLQPVSADEPQVFIKQPVEEEVALTPTKDPVLQEQPDGTLVKEPVAYEDPVLVESSPSKELSPTMSEPSLEPSSGGASEPAELAYAK